MAYRSSQSRSSVQSKVNWLLNLVHHPKPLGLLRSTQPVVQSLLCFAEPIGDFILFGNILVFIGAVLGGTSHTIGQSILAHCFIGFCAGNCQLAAFALPELLPNKWRHFTVVIADGMIFFTVIVGPVTARIAILHGDAVSPKSVSDRGCQCLMTF
jgi:hypothetical protein